MINGVQDFLAAFQMELIDYRVYMEQVILLAKFNLITASNPTEISKQIAALDVSSILNTTTFTNVESSRTALATLLDGYVPSADEDKRKELSDKFAGVLKIFQDMDTTIDMSNIYNTYYNKTQIARSLFENELSFEPSKALSAFVDLVGILVGN